jgi:hypothetical protein
MLPKESLRTRTGRRMITVLTQKSSRNHIAMVLRPGGRRISVSMVVLRASA